MTLPPRLRAAEASTADERPYQFQWRVPIVHKETVERELRFEGVVTEEKDNRGIPLMFVFVGVALLPDLVGAIYKLIWDMVHGGVVIDARGEEIEVDTDKSLTGGLIVVRTLEGTQIYKRDEVNTAELVAALMKTK